MFDKNNELIKLAKTGDSEALEQLFSLNMGLVKKIALRFLNRGIEPDDAIQIGCIGLQKAIEKFDFSYDVQFSTYAVPMIIGEVKRFVRDVNSMRISRSIRDTAYRVLQTRNELEKKDEQVTFEKIAEKMNTPLKEVVYAMDAISDTVSLFDPVYNKNGDELLLVDQIGDEKNTEERWTEKVALQSAISLLGEREKKILYLRYYEGKTQTEISFEVGISQAQVSRLEKNALKEIKNSIMA